MRWGWTLAILLIVIGLLPVLGLAVMSVVAALGDCRVHEGFAQPCFIAGVDWGGTLYALGMGGWLLFLTAPIALAGIVLGIGLALTSLVRRARD